MSQNKHFAGKIIIAAGVSMLLGVSAFGESRHRNETDAGMRDSGGEPASDRGRPWSRGGGSRDTMGRLPDSGRERPSRGEEPRRDVGGTSVGPEQAPDGDRVGDRGDRRTGDDGGDRRGSWNRGDRNRGDDRDRHGNRNQRDNHGGGWNRDRHDRQGREVYSGRGRVSRCERYGSGYRVWLSGSSLPFFVPSALYDSRRFRVGIALDLWGYYNPLGYYDYYDSGDHSYCGVRSEFRGVVEEVDDRRDRIVVRDDDRGNFVTVHAGRCRVDDVRPGDYVRIEGDWTGSSAFIASDIRILVDDVYDDDVYNDEDYDDEDDER